ncbi:hypothetical protein ACIGXM_35195 [Kitasatospora sp. NPDC052896]|uniref:hypothetical protein n=1 Tax=Kitasatospora sp. NPDC052896 TaxID=3364061 RepID=UPI0037C5BA6E
MSTDFSVDLAELDKLVAGLRSSADDLASALDGLGLADGHRTGTESIDQACEHFRGRWQHGLGRLRDCVQALDGGLAAVRRNYQQTETEVAASIGKETSP